MNQARLTKSRVFVDSAVNGAGALELVWTKPYWTKTVVERLMVLMTRCVEALYHVGTRPGRDFLFKPASCWLLYLQTETIPRSTWLIKLSCITTSPREWLNYAEQKMRYANKPVTCRTLSFQKMFLNRNLGGHPKCSVIVRILLLTPLASLVNRNCYGPLGRQACQNVLDGAEHGIFVFSCSMKLTESRIWSERGRLCMTIFLRYDYKTIP